MSAITQNKQGIKVLVAGCVLQLLFGIVYVWSVYVKPVSDFYVWDIEKVKLMTSYMLSFFVVGILTGGWLMARIGVQRVVLLGGMMLAAGMLASGLLPKDEAARWMYLTYGMAGGFGAGLGYNALISAAQKWFPRHRGLATGVSVGAFGFATVIFAPLIETLIKSYGLCNTFFILAAVFFAATLSMFKFISLPDDSAPGGASAALLAKRQYALSETVRTLDFYLIALSMMFATAAFFVLNPSFKTFAAERGFSDSIGTVIVMSTGVANALGRILTPMISDRIGREKALISIICATAACALLLCFATGPLFMAAILIIVFSFGGYAGIFPVLTADYFGIKNVGANYGAVMVGFAISALCFPMVIGQISNITTKFIVLGSIAGTAAVLVVLLMAGKKKAGR